jgi:hypothetical protein
MTDADRFRLLYGTCRTPRLHYGEALRSELVVCGLTDAPTP